MWLLHVPMCAYHALMVHVMYWVRLGLGGSHPHFCATGLTNYARVIFSTNIDLPNLKFNFSGAFASNIPVGVVYGSLKHGELSSVLSLP